MIEKDLNTLAELEKEVEDLRKLIENSRLESTFVVSPVIFRGQRTSCWNLESTLERYSKETFSVGTYNGILTRISPVINSFTEKEWGLDTIEDYIDLDLHDLPNLDFMSYVRHHGFPTPTIDWTKSLYVALFFAFHNVDLNKTKRVSVFAYIDSTKGIKVGDEDEYAIKLIDTGNVSHKRHHMQQGCYTIAYKRDPELGWVYGSHHDLFKRETERLEQDVLYKFTLPVNQRDNILKKLFEMNINAYTLYSNEESLLEMLAYKEMVLKN